LEVKEELFALAFHNHHKFDGCMMEEEEEELFPFCIAFFVICFFSLCFQVFKVFVFTFFFLFLKIN
jgi:hypothetical protein